MNIIGLYMKKFIVLLFSCLLLICSCTSTPASTPVIYKNEVTTSTFDRIIKFDFENHKYIWFRSLNGGYTGWDGGIVHDPDCDCMIDYD